jgi:hypothetical protein
MHCRNPPPFGDGCFVSMGAPPRSSSSVINRVDARDLGGGGAGRMHINALGGGCTGVQGHWTALLAT